MNPRVTPDRIENAYRQLGYKLNWGFLTCPVANFQNPSTLLVALNPGGGRGDAGDPSWERQKMYSQEEGNEYVVGDWNEDGNPGNAPLQRQIQGLCRFINQPIEALASANFVPFQSPTWAELPNKEQALAFARELWADVIEGLAPRYVIALGTEAGFAMKTLFGVDTLIERKINWGSVKVRFGSAKHGSRFVILPHLSRYQVFNTDGSENDHSSALREAFGLNGAACA